MRGDRGPSRGRTRDLCSDDDRGPRRDAPVRQSRRALARLVQGRARRAPSGPAIARAPEPGGSSRGSRQRAGIARPLAPAPPVLLLDEPATALDPEMSRTLRSFIVSLRARHRAILLTTHDLDEAQRIADRLVVLYKGKVLRTGATADIRAAGRPTYTVSFSGDATTARDALARAGIEAESASARDGLTALRFAADDPTAMNPVALRALLDAGVHVVTLAAEERSLEDAYLSILAEARR